MMKYLGIIITGAKTGSVEAERFFTPSYFDKWWDYSNLNYPDT